MDGRSVDDRWHRPAERTLDPYKLAAPVAPGRSSPDISGVSESADVRKKVMVIQLSSSGCPGVSQAADQRRCVPVGAA